MMTQLQPTPVFSPSIIDSDINLCKAVGQQGDLVALHQCLATLKSLPDQVAALEMTVRLLTDEIASLHRANESRIGDSDNSLLLPRNGLQGDVMFGPLSGGVSLARDQRIPCAHYVFDEMLSLDADRSGAVCAKLDDYSDGDHGVTVLSKDAHHLFDERSSRCGADGCKGDCAKLVDVDEGHQTNFILSSISTEFNHGGVPVATIGLVSDAPTKHDKVGVVIQVLCKDAKDAPHLFEEMPIQCATKCSDGAHTIGVLSKDAEDARHVF